jgi:hypothetical protein
MGSAAGARKWEGIEYAATGTFLTISGGYLAIRNYSVSSFKLEWISLGLLFAAGGAYFAVQAVRAFRASSGNGTASE